MKIKILKQKPKKSVDEIITNIENCTRCQKRQNEKKADEIRWKILHIVMKFE